MTRPVFRILGPLEIELNDDVVALGRRERALLGVLLLNAGEVVSVERLIDGVWGGAPPASAKHMVHEYVSRLRQALGDSSRIVTRVPGYIAVCSEEELDARRFSALAEAARTAARAGEHEDALRSYDEALRLWRGDALAGAELEGDARIDAARLDQERLLLKEERIDNALALGRHRELIPELERHVRDEPLRERPRAQLMLALYRSGRQTDALEHYRQARAALVEHAGIEPGQELLGLERAILQHDPELELPPPVSPAGKPLSRAGDRDRPAPRRGRRTIVAVAGAVMVAGVAAAAWLTFSRGDDSEPAAIEGNSVAVVDPERGRRTGSIGVAGGPAAGPSPSAVTAGAGSIWVANVDSHTVSRIDPAKRVVIQTIPVGHNPAGIAFGAGFVWVTDALDGTVSKIDPRTNTRVQRIPVGNAPAGIAVGAGDVWVANSNDRSVTRIDARTGKPGHVTAVESGADDVAVGEGSVWVAGHSSGTVTRIDARSGRTVDLIRVGNGAAAVTVGAGSVWVANSLDGTVTRIDPVSNAVSATIPVGAGPNGLAVTREGIWVSNELAGTLMKIDRDRNTVVSTVQIGNRPVGVALGPEALFVAVRASGTGHEGGTLTVLGPKDIVLNPDATRSSHPEAAQLFALTNDGLTGFRRVGGSAGTRLVPDLAVSLPTPTDGGRTYRFQLRPGIRYSTGTFVRPQDFRRSIERAIALPYTGMYFSRIVGAQKCLAHRTRPCDLSGGIETDSRSNTVVFHLTTPDPEFLVKLALPAAFAVPDGTPVHVKHPLPATGPYMLASTPTTTTRLIRNPWFREWSRIAQPRGFPDRIVVHFEGSPDSHVTAVLRGSADVASDLSRTSPSVFAAVRTQHASRLERNPAGFTLMLVLNTRVPPFDDVRVRRALNYAVDRERLRDTTVGPGLGRLTCQILPPNYPGYLRYCPYTSSPSRGGRWKAPDLARARALVRSSGTAGQAVTVWMPEWLHYANADGAKYVASVLSSLGYKARYRVVPDPYLEQDRIRLQLGFGAWTGDYATPYGFVGYVLTCAAYNPVNVDNSNTAKFCDPEIDAAIARAQKLRTSDVAASSRVWAKIEHDIVDRAPWVPYANGLVPELLSDRVGNYQYHPQWGTLLGQLWVK